MTLAAVARRTKASTPVVASWKFTVQLGVDLALRKTVAGAGVDTVGAEV